MIGFVSFRYAFSHSSGQRGRAIRAMITIALSLVAVTVVMSVMEFLQEGMGMKFLKTLCFYVVFCILK